MNDSHAKTCLDYEALKAGLQPVLKALHADLLERAQSDASVDASLRRTWEDEKKSKRTSDAFEVWRRRRCVQVSIAWILSCIFVRTLEDRGYLPRRRIAGEGAVDSESQFLALAPFLNQRDYLLTVFREMSRLPGAAGIFDTRYNLVWRLSPSANGAKRLLDFFRNPAKDGSAAPSFEGDDTRFLGDLYQDLDEDTRKRFALLQTPDFVEEFILEQTLDPAIAEFGLGEVRLIDPTCGSGHFLIGAFRRLFEAWQKEEPATERQVLAQRALSQVYGTDINPYAVAIARFRLIYEFLEIVGEKDLVRVPRLSLNVIIADSLFWGVGKSKQTTFSHEEDGKTVSWIDSPFAVENVDEALEILQKGFHAVVGNPPYITEKDTAKRDSYRELYKSAARQFSLAAPFTERFFHLAVSSGFVGMINANSFMKREFGKSLIELVLPKLDLTKIIDTSGAYVPGHGTPTVLLFGRNQAPQFQTITAILGNRGEPSTPEVPKNGFVWSAIRSNHSNIGFDDEFITVSEIERSRFNKHPWSVSGGGSSELQAKIEAVSEKRLESIVKEIGRTTHSGMDPVFYMPSSAANFVTVESRRVWLVKGEDVRDYNIALGDQCLFPYERNSLSSVEPELVSEKIYFWKHRTSLKNRIDFGKFIEERGLKWFEHSMFFPKRFKTPLSITFAEVATHNNFVLDRGGKVFKQTAPVIKLPKDATEDDHLALLGLLNSSLACFWLKQVAHKKGYSASASGARTTAAPWEDFYQFDSTKIKSLPIKTHVDLVSLARSIDSLARHRNENSIVSLLSANDWADLTELEDRLANFRDQDTNMLLAMVSVQEELVLSHL